MATKGAAAGGGERYYQAADPLIGDFMAELLRKNRSARTLEAYARDLEHFGAFLTWGTIERPATSGTPAPAVFPALRTADASAIRRPRSPRSDCRPSSGSSPAGAMSLLLNEPRPGDYGRH